MSVNLQIYDWSAMDYFRLHEVINLAMITEN